MATLYLIALATLLLLSFTYMIYLLYSMWSAAPFVPTPKRQVQTMLTLAQIQSGERVMDIGSGDGRLVFAAAERGARAIGIEINPILYAWSALKAKFRHRRRVAFRRENFWRTDLSDVDVLTVYCLPGKMDRLQNKLARELKPGARVVVHAFPFPDWPYEKKDGKIYLYKI